MVNFRDETFTAPMATTFTKTKLPNGWLGNMASFPIEFGGLVWRTSEALFQARRFAWNDSVRDQIRAATSPMTSKMIAKMNRARTVVTPWSSEDVDLMRDVLQLKLAQHTKLEGLLRDTGEAVIVEDCTARRSDPLFWGAARTGATTWCGRNTLGRLWMDLRAAGM